MVMLIFLWTDYLVHVVIIKIGIVWRLDLSGYSFPDCHKSRVGNRSVSVEEDRHCVPRADDGAWYVRTTISLFYRTEIDLNIVVWTYVVFASC